LIEAHQIDVLPKIDGTRGLLLKLLNTETLLEAGAVNADGKDRFCVPGLGVLADASGRIVT
jgi:hypothetical protein